MRVSQWLKNGQFWLLPGVCVVCQRPSDRDADLCARCEPALRPLERPCLTCALPLPAGDYASPRCGRCLGEPARLARTVAAFAYAEPASSLIAGFKYRAALEKGRVLGDLLTERVRAQYGAQPLPQLLVPVPLHPARLRERGFNQALVLARQLGAALHIPVAAEALQRIRHTPSQQGQSARERKRNLRGAFRVNEECPLLECASLALVDDVVTTMSTVRELARVLRHRHPALTIHAWCLARA